MAATRDVGRRALHRMTGSVSGVNWRPTLFEDEVTLNRYACCICYVLPSTTFVLPCSHGLCKKCCAGCVIEDGGSVCPLDGESFCEAECQELQLPARKKRGLKAYCWNKPYGCDFVGPLVAVLHHYEEDCTFHTFQCQQCGENIMIDVLAAHYMGRCSNISSSAAIDEVPGQDDTSVASHDVTVVRHEADEQLLCTYEEDRITALQRSIDTLTVLATNIDARLDETEEQLEKLEMKS
ncbi:uncharacterized protein [Dermacentor andersoni]|uniref:uncharacterized protein n=1 Tax=Dermacentor andersoni TaxID=34620 RepID=UPI002155F771|nr:TNF receptor-associated factor 5-like [Dermacentor andersoni]XP_050033769.1 TNF receptor-associated factor 5-like [Dermacentor andersoni]